MPPQRPARAHFSAHNLCPPDPCGCCRLLTPAPPRSACTPAPPPAAAARPPRGMSSTRYGLSTPPPCPSTRPRCTTKCTTASVRGLQIPAGPLRGCTRLLPPCAAGVPARLPPAPAPRRRRLHAPAAPPLALSPACPACRQGLPQLLHAGPQGGDGGGGQDRGDGLPRVLLLLSGQPRTTPEHMLHTVGVNSS